MELYGSDMCVIEVTVSVVTVKYCGIYLKFCVCMFVDLLPSEVVTARCYASALHAVVVECRCPIAHTCSNLLELTSTYVNLTDLKWNS